jgi:hypothetical protein
MQTCFPCSVGKITKNVVEEPCVPVFVSEKKLEDGGDFGTLLQR